MSKCGPNDLARCVKINLKAKINYLFTYDKNQTFCDLSEQVINYLYSEAYEKRVKIVLPYKDCTKEDMLRMYVEQGGDIKKAWDETFSCYEPINGQMCGKCSSCTKRIEAFKKNGFNPEI